MKKKIIAGVAALLMVASCVPGNAMFNFSPVTPVVVTAASASETVTINNVTVTIIINADGTVALQPRTAVDMGLNSSMTDLNVDLSAFKDKVMEMRNAADTGGFTKYSVTLRVPASGTLNNETKGNLAHIYFNDDLITAIDSSFAMGCTHLQTVDFGSTITNIGNNAFNGCSILQGSNKSTTLDVSNVTEIGDSAFSGCKMINKIKFGNNLTAIGKSAFFNNSALTSLELPESLETLNDSSFSGCAQLETVEFASNDHLGYIGITAFSGCAKLTAVTVKGRVGNTIPDGAPNPMGGTGIFKGCTSLQSFVWPNEYVVIPGDCFNGCTSLNEFKFGTGPADSKCQIIRKQAFANCSALVNIELPDANIGLEDYVFADCKKLEKVIVSEDLEYVGTYAFANCPVLTLYPRNDPNKTKNKVVLPPKWTILMDNTFYNDIGITQVDISPAVSMGKAVFMNCRSLKEVSIPDAVTDLNENVFNGCSSLKDVVVSKNLRYIGQSAFNNCKALETLTPTDAKKLDYTIQFPAQLGGVQQSGFQNCASFKYLNFAENTEFSVVGPSSFQGCTGLLGSNIGGNANNTIEMPVGVQVIEKSAFNGDTSLDKITFLGSVATVAEAAFEKCTSLEEVIMNDTITQVGASAFKGCSSLKSMPKTAEGKSAFTHIDIINNSTFEDCAALESAYIPKNVSQIGQKAFQKCKAMTSVQWEEGSKLYDIGSDAFRDCTALERFSSSTSGTLSVFPNSVQHIRANAFASDNLKEIKIVTPADGSTVYLGASAFAGNNALTKADLSESNIDEIPASCFANCTMLNTVRLPETYLVKVGEAAFSNCSYLHTLGDKNAPEGEYTIPASLTSIGNRAFENNYCMQIINFPKTATLLSMSMFNISIKEDVVQEKGYTPLEAINVDKDNPNYTSVDGILYNKDMSTLLCRPIRMTGDSFVVPNSVTTISESACAANIFLKNVTLNENLKSIANKAFGDCHKLEYVDFGKNGTVTLGNTVFTRSGGKITLYGTSNSTAQAYAANTSNTSYVLFVDNAKTAAKLNILNKDGATINKLTLAKKTNTYQLGCQQLDANGEESADTLVWSTSDPEVATINNNGLLTIKGMGEITVTVRNANDTTSTSITLVVNEDGSSGIVGDVNDDGKVDILDVSKVVAHVKSVKKLSGKELERADVNSSGAVDIKDVSMLVAHVKGAKKLSQ